MNNTLMRSAQDPDGYPYVVDSCRQRLNARDPPEGPTHRQYEDIIPQALAPGYKAMRQAHLDSGGGEFWACHYATYDGGLLTRVTSVSHTLIQFGVQRDAVPPCRQWSEMATTSTVTFVIVTSNVCVLSAPSTSSSRSSVEITRTTRAGSEVDYSRQEVHHLFFVEVPHFKRAPPYKPHP